MASPDPVTRRLAAEEEIRQLMRIGRKRSRLENERLDALLSNRRYRRGSWAPGTTQALPLQLQPDILSAVSNRPDAQYRFEEATKADQELRHLIGLGGKRTPADNARLQRLAQNKASGSGSWSDLTLIPGLPTSGYAAKPHASKKERELAAYMAARDKKHPEQASAANIKRYGVKQKKMSALGLGDFPEPMDYSADPEFKREWSKWYRANKDSLPDEQRAFKRRLNDEIGQKRFRESMNSPRRSYDRCDPDAPTGSGALNAMPGGMTESDYWYSNAGHGETPYQKTNRIRSSGSRTGQDVGLLVTKGAAAFGSLVDPNTAASLEQAVREGRITRAQKDATMAQIGNFAVTAGGGLSSLPGALGGLGRVAGTVNNLDTAITAAQTANTVTDPSKSWRERGAAGTQLLFSYGASRAANKLGSKLGDYAEGVASARSAKATKRAGGAAETSTNRAAASAPKAREAAPGGRSTASKSAKAKLGAKLDEVKRRGTAAAAKSAKKPSTTTKKGDDRAWRLTGDNLPSKQKRPPKLIKPDTRRARRRG